MEQRTLITSIKPPADIFAKDGFNLQQRDEEVKASVLYDRTEYPEDGGIFVYYADHPYPLKGHPFPEAVNSVQAPKKLFMAISHMLNRHKITAGLFFILPPFVTRRYIQSYIDTHVLNYCDATLKPFKLVEERYCKMVQEIRRTAFSTEEFASVVRSIPGIKGWSVSDAQLPILTPDMQRRVNEDPVKGHVMDFSPISQRVIVQKE